MPRVTTCLVSDYQRDRVHSSRFFRGESRKFTVEFKGCIPDGVFVSSAKWQVYNPYTAIISDGAGTLTATSVTLTAGYPGVTVITVTAQLSNGKVINQQCLITILASPWYTGDTVNQGPYSIIVNNQSPYVTVTGDLGNGAVGDPVGMAYMASGGTGPYTWSIYSGTLPTGLSLNSTTGAVTGTRSVAGSFTFVVQAIDSLGKFGQDVDMSNTADAPLPPLTGTVSIDSQIGNGQTPASAIEPRGQWYFIVADQDVTGTGQNNLYVNGQLVSSVVDPAITSPLWYIFTVGNSSNPTLATIGFTGLLYGAGVINQGVTQQDVDYLYNSGNGVRFATMRADTSPEAISLWSRMFFAWQLNEPSGSSTYADQKGNSNLVKTGTVGSYVDAKFGNVAKFTRSGVLTTTGSPGPTSHRTLFTWAYIQTINVPRVQEMIMGNYDAISEGKAIFSNFVSD